VAVKHQFVLSAGEVAVHQCKAVFINALSGDLAARGLLALVIWRSVEREQELCAFVACSGGGFGIPEIFADHDPDLDAVLLKYQGHCAWREVAHFVEHGVVGQQHFFVAPQKIAVADDEGCIDAFARPAGWAAYDQRDAIWCLIDQSADLAAAFFQKRWAQQQVFGRVARERKFRSQQ